MSTTLPLDSPSGIDASKAAPPPQADDVFEFPATLGEKRFWLLDQLQPGNPAFNMPLAFDLAGPLDAGALEKSLREIVRRHEILRTTFAAVDGEVRQIVAAAGEPGWSAADLSHVPDADREAEVDREVLEEARRPFSLERGPLIRGRLLRLAPEKHVLLVTMHHIVCDGWSNGVLVRELGALYEAYSTGKPSPLPDLPIQYADYAIWQKEWLEGQRFDESLAWWRERLAGPLADVAVPADRPRRLGRASAGVITSRLLPPELSRALKALSRREDATLFMVFLAGFQSLLFRYTGTKDVILCSPSANRHPPETEALIGSFAHPLILRTDLSGDPTFRDVLVRVRDGALGAFNHQAIPFERLVEELARTGAAGVSYMPRIMFIYQTAFMQPVELPNLSFKPRRSVSPGSQFEIVLSVVERAEGHRLQLEYNPDLHDADTIATLLSHLETLLTAAAARPETPVAALPLWTEAELAAMLEKSETPSDDPRRPARAAAASPGGEAVASRPAAARRVEPRNEVEARLRKIWERLLGHEPIGVEDDYFELGGHSLIAVQLMSEIERSFGRRLPLATLVQAPTIAQMAVLLEETRPETAESWPSLVPIQTAGSKLPLFCVHAVGGNVLNYIDLSRHLGNDQPVYGLQAVGLDGRSLPHTRVEDMAAHYIEQIRHVQPHGPYAIGGTSAGGLVVFEMAQQLVAAGERVAVLALFDAWAPGYPRRVPGITPLQVGWNRLRTRVDLHVSNLVAAEGLREKSAYLFRKALRARRAAYVAGRRYWHRVRDPIRGFVDATPRTLREVENATRKASDVYVPRPYPGKLTLFRATKQPAGIYPDPHLGWSDLAAGGIDVYDVPGHHGAIVYEPRVGALAARLEECLAAAAGRAS